MRRSGGFGKPSTASLGRRRCRWKTRSAGCLAEDVVAPVDVPFFDRSNYDGYAVRAADTYGAQEETPRQLKLLSEVLATGVVAAGRVVRRDRHGHRHRGRAAPRGRRGGHGRAHRSCRRKTPDQEEPWCPVSGSSFAGTDITAGETVLRRGRVADQPRNGRAGGGRRDGGRGAAAAAGRHHLDRR